MKQRADMALCRWILSDVHTGGCGRHGVDCSERRARDVRAGASWGGNFPSIKRGCHRAEIGRCPVGHWWDTQGRKTGNIRKQPETAPARNNLFLLVLSIPLCCRYWYVLPLLSGRSRVRFALGAPNKTNGYNIFHFFVFPFCSNFVAPGITTSFRTKHALGGSACIAGSRQNTKAKI